MLLIALTFDIFKEICRAKDRTTKRSTTEDNKKKKKCPFNIITLGVKPGRVTVLYHHSKKDRKVKTLNHHKVETTHKSADAAPNHREGWFSWDTKLPPCILERCQHLSIRPSIAVGKNHL